MITYPELTVSALFRTPNSSRALPYLEKYSYPWEVLADIGEMLAELAKALPHERFEVRAEGVYVAKSARVADSALLVGPCIIDEKAEVRQGAFIRGGALVGRGAVVGNSVELKNCILFDGVQVPHFNYVGDSILGYRAHMGAGAVTSNVKGDRSEVTVSLRGERIATGRVKCGAFLGDLAEIGCNCVLNPGTVIGRCTQVYPLTSVRTYLPPNAICKGEGRIVLRRDQ